jgi:hypothetical protein
MNEQEMRQAAELFVREGQERYARVLRMFERNPRGLLQLLYVVHGLKDHVPGLYRHADNVAELTSAWIQAGCPSDTEEFLGKLTAKWPSGSK